MMASQILRSSGQASRAAHRGPSPPGDRFPKDFWTASIKGKFKSLVIIAIRWIILGISVPGFGAHGLLGFRVIQWGNCADDIDIEPYGSI
jgi:hypothetical protein